MASLPQNPFAVDTKPEWQQGQTLDIGRHRFILQKQLNLTTLLSDLSSSKIQGTEPRYIYIYCDTLELDWITSNNADGNIVKAQVAPPIYVRELRIKARNFFPAAHTRQSNDTDLSTLLPATLEVLLPGLRSGEVFICSVISSDTPDNLSFEFKSTTTKLTVVPNQVGFWFSILESGGRGAGPIQEVPPGQLEFNMSDIITIDGIRTPRFFGQLLENLFVEAATLIANPSRLPDAVSMFRFIIICSKHAPSYAELNIQSTQMLAKADLLASGVYPIPNTSVERGEKSLIYWLDESKIKSSQAQVETILKTVIAGTATIKEIGAVIVQQLGYSHENYPLNLDLARQELLVSTAHYSSRRAEFEQADTDLTKQQQKFNIAVEKWKEDKQGEAIIGIVFATIEAVGAVAGAIASGGASSAAAVSSVAKAVGAAQKLGETIEKFADLMQKLSKLQTKFTEFIKLIQTLHNVYDTVKASAEQDSSSDILVAQQIVPALAGTVDFVGLKLKWSDYSIDVKNMFQVMRAAFDGLSPQAIGDFEVAVSKLTTRATAVVDALKDIQLLSNKVSRAEADVRRLQARQKELNGIAAEMRDDAVSQREMAAGLQIVSNAEASSLKRWLFMSMHEYALSCVYSTSNLGAMSILDFSATGSLTYYTNSLNRLSQYVDSNTSSKRDKSISFSTRNDSFVFNPFWRQALQTVQNLHLTVDPNQTQFENWRSALIKGVNISMKGLSLKPGQTKRDQVLFKVGLDQSMQVKLQYPPASDLRVANFYSDFSDDLLAQEVIVTPMADSTDLFETKKGTEMSPIASKKITPSLFGLKIIRLSLESQKVFDLSKVEDVTVTFLCDVAYV